MSLSTDVAALAAAARRGLNNGSSLTGVELRLLIDTLQTLANTTESKASATAVALEALLVTHIANWVAVGTGDSAAVRATAITALATPRTAAVAAAAASVTNVTVDDKIDGRTA